MTDGAQCYNVAAIRELLLAAFTADDLRRLLLYTSNQHLKPLQQQFSPGDGLEAMVEKTITYCQTRGLLPDLSEEVKEANPRQYALFEKKLFQEQSPVSEQEVPASTSELVQSNLIRELVEAGDCSVRSITILLALAFVLTVLILALFPGLWRADTHQSPPTVAATPVSSASDTPSTLPTSAPTQEPLDERDPPIPTAGAQLDFSPDWVREPEMENDPQYWIDSLGLRHGEHPGIYVSSLNEGLHVNSSWEVHYSDGSWVYGETNVCLINLTYPEMLQSPLSLKARNIVLEFVVYVDHRYSLMLTDLDLVVANYTPARTDIAYIRSREPGANGQGLPFKTVRTNRAFVDRDNPTSFKIEFPDFQLKPNEGVTFWVPVTMNSAGEYQFQVKVNALAEPTYEDDGYGITTLTTGRTSWHWAYIDDPLQYVLDTDNFIACP